jgi:hypothetical protein
MCACVCSDCGWCQMAGVSSAEHLEVIYLVLHELSKKTESIAKTSQTYDNNVLVFHFSKSKLY